MQPLILASTSAYRRELLGRLGLPFEAMAPGVEEDYIEGEKAPQRALRLSLAKAKAVASRFPEAVVIGSDQVAALADEILDKPGNRENTQKQLRALSGQTARFYSGCAVIVPRTGHELAEVVVTEATFRALSGEEIIRYIEREPAFDCAGGAKAEGLGIALTQRLESPDPTALIGLPLIWLAGALRQAGFQIP